MKFTPIDHNYFPNSQQSGINRRRLLDYPLMFSLLLLAGSGFIILYSAGDQNIDIVIRQAIRIAIAFGVMFLLGQIHPKALQRQTPLLFLIGIILLIVVLIAGDIGKGAQRWLNLGFFRFQPSEMLKITTPMMIAWYLSEKPLPPRLLAVSISTLLILIPALLIAKQPDLGTAILIASSGAAVLFISGISWKIIIGIMAAIGAFLPLLWYTLMHDYQRDRILTFFNPETDPLGKGYHIIQSKIAIGSGGIYGKGWLQGTQTRLEFLPERPTDFIFAVFAEEFGLLGCLGLLSLYVIIIARCLFISIEAQDSYSRLLAGSLTITFFVYVFVNIAMVTGILPVVGIPLPLISYGGTSMVTLLAGFGILMSIQTHKNLLPS